jgi:hypothetical protein
VFGVKFEECENGNFKLMVEGSDKILVESIKLNQLPKDRQCATGAARADKKPSSRKLHSYQTALLEVVKGSMK